MKRPVALLLLLIVCAMSCMLPLRYGLKQAAKAMMYVRLMQQSPDTFMLMAASDLEDVEWTCDREFRLDGTLYDVAGVAYHEGLLYYRCMADELETRLERHAEDFAGHMLGHSHGKKQQRRSSRPLLSWLHALYFQPARPFEPAPVFSVRKHYFLSRVHFPEDPWPSKRLIPPEP